MDAKIIGYILSALGLIGIVVSNKNIIGSVPFLQTVPTQYILIPAIIMVGMGIVLIMSKSTSKYHPKTKMGEEVPIFKGKEIVGYRITK